MDPRTHRAELDAERRADLFVGQSLDVAQHDCGPELRQQVIKRGLQVGIEIRVAESLFR